AEAQGMKQQGAPRSIWIFADASSAGATEVQKRTTAHFRDLEAVRLCWGQQERASPQLGDVAVVILERGRDDDWSRLADSRLATCLRLGIPTTPLLVDGLKMPARDQLPAEVADLAWKHGLDLRTDERLPRDVGRLIMALESQLRRVEGESFGYEYLTFPLGILATTVGAFYWIVRLREFGEWSFAYETVDQLETADRTLRILGPAMLGAGGLSLSAAVWWRLRRRALAEQAEAMRSGKGSPRDVPDTWGWAALCLAAASLGWGRAVATASAALAVTSLLRRMLRGVGRAGRSGHAASRDLSRSATLTLATLAFAILAFWGAGLASGRRSELRDALSRYEAARASAATQDVELIHRRFAAVVEADPTYANLYLRWAEALTEAGDDAAALEKLNQAVERYPRDSQGFVSPPRKLSAQAYRLRAQLLRSEGSTEAADQDEKTASNVDPWLKIFDGLVRFW
ncbi:MAG: hypothetical protein KDA61_01005, partial [Planctomycetales bacterium]|nr:hypothetical protein [Planctomycetales bacterium]